MKNIIRGIKNVIKWLPIIWRQKDNSYTELYDVMIFKMENLANKLNENNKTDEAKEITSNISRLKTCRDETFITMAINKYKYELYSEVSKAKNDSEKLIIINKYKARMSKARKIHNINKERAFKVFTDNIENWWCKD